MEPTDHGAIGASEHDSDAGRITPTRDDFNGLEGPDKPFTDEAIAEKAPEAMVAVSCYLLMFILSIGGAIASAIR